MHKKVCPNSDNSKKYSSFEDCDGEASTATRINWTIPMVRGWDPGNTYRFDHGVRLPLWWPGLWGIPVYGSGNLRALNGVLSPRISMVMSEKGAVQELSRGFVLA